LEDEAQLENGLPLTSLFAVTEQSANLYQWQPHDSPARVSCRQPIFQLGIFRTFYLSFFWRIMRLSCFNFYFALVVFGIVPLAASCTFGQNKNAETANNKTAGGSVIEENKFTVILAKATENLKGRTYRLTKTEETFADRDAEPEATSKNILEVVPPNKGREVSELKSAEKNAKTERIWDGKNLYERKNDGEWRKYSGGGNGGGGDFVSGRITTTFKFVGQELLNGRKTNVYERESHRIANKFTRTSQIQVEYIEKTRYWINEDGSYLKSVKESEIANSKSLVRETAVYEYDNSITIEAPIK
jgi:hypothetical protein